MRVLLVDDEAPARHKLRRLLASEPDVEICGEAADGAAAVLAIRELQPELVFLDIRMPELDGFEVVDTIGAAEMPSVVFVTAYDEHALRAFEVRALDYLLKPVAPSRFAETLARVRLRLRERTRARSERLDGLLEQVASTPRYLKRLLVEREGRAELLAIERVELIEAARNYLCIVAGGTTHVIRNTLAALERRLDPGQFVRVNRSQIVRMDAIRELRACSHGDSRLFLHNGRELMWSRRYRQRHAHHFEVGA